jgi:enediyne biosynthesis protein E7
MAVATPLPPGPEEEVDLATIRCGPLAFLEAMTERYGDVSRHRAGGWEVVLVNRPELARRVLRDNRGNYTKEGTPDDMMLTPLLGRGLLTSEGQAWRRQRQLSAPAFRRHRVARFDALMADAASELLAEWRRRRAGEPLRVDHDLASLTLGVVARALMGSDVAIGNRFGGAVDDVNRFMSHYDPDSGSAGSVEDRAAFDRARAFLEMIVGLLIEAGRIEGGDGDHLLAAMLGARSADAPEGLSPRELRDQMLTFLMAGHETTAKALTWCLYLIDAHPEVREGLEREVDAVLGDRDPTAADLPRLPRCRSALLETMRLFPPVWLISRRALSEDRIGGYRVPAGALVCVSPYLLHRHPAEWERPGDFLPERFGEGAEPPGFSYLPFSGGPRQCIGRSFALLEAQIVLAVLVRGARLRLLPGHAVEPEALVTLRPRDGLVMTLEPRCR